MKLKVLALVPDFIQKPSGGMGEQFRHLRDKLKDAVDFYICGYPENNNIENYKSVASIIHSNHAFLTTIYGQSVYFQKALEFQQDFDVIHAFDWSTFIAGGLYAKHFKKPLICTVQLSLKCLNEDGIYFCGDPTSFDGRCINDMQVQFEDYGLKNSNAIIHVSEAYAKKFPMYLDKTTIIYNGIEPLDWVKQRDVQLPGFNKIKFCYIGRAATMKGIDLILNTNIPDDVDMYFVVSEKNAEKHLYNEIIKKCNGKNIFHINGLYGQNKIDFLFAMDGVIMPSRHEPFGIVALEAIASKNILVTTDAGGIEEITKNVIHLRVADSAGIEGAINEIKKLTKDERENITNLNQIEAFKFNWDSSAQKLLNVYKNTVNN